MSNYWALCNRKYPKEHTWFNITWPIMQRYAHFIDLIDNIAWKKVRYTLTSPTQTNLFWHFPSIYSFQCRSKKDYIVCARNLRQNSYSYLLLYSCSFLLLWMCSNNFGKREITINCLPKCIVLLSPLQISRKFLNYYAMQKILVTASAICLQKNPDVSVWQETVRGNSD